MPVDLSAVGHRGPPTPVSWTADQALLYALGVGAGADDPLAELEFTTENSSWIEHGGGGGEVWFRVVDGSGAVVLDRGRARIGGPE